MTILGCGVTVGPGAGWALKPPQHSRTGLWLGAPLPSTGKICFTTANLQRPPKCIDVKFAAQRDLVQDVTCRFLLGAGL